ncbi:MULTISPECIES: SDR family NAD(P)-dependent oxidoreductase [Corallococcus]|uniref:SDR family NAD(P)-dependent oxidoreductase n=1 Tax=Corallococcus TaxID=83461 RepID=UPI001180AA8A|nr:MULTISPECIES: SDR family oxidoreductase [Corallococcus]NBD11306.1 SDR family oxidoreductase [Corallococcus silvisoli]TSC26510.1 SDR family oxidoreductase [Corallococcus sp. Z5C101001]
MSIEKTPVALITGASRGIGRATALTLAERGVDVIVTYVSAEKEANDVVESIRDKGRKAVALRLDLAMTDTFDAFVGDVKTQLMQTWSRERLDFLVNNGGAGGPVSFAETTESTFDALVGVHFKGPFFLTQKLLPVLADGGRIVNVSTGLTRYTIPGVSVYAAVKSALEAVTRVLALELGPRRIAVNSVAPGGIVTDYGGGFMRTNEQLRKAVVAETPLGRLGEPEDVADIIASLLSHDTRWLTGQRIEATGGYRL